MRKTPIARKTRLRSRSPIKQGGTSGIDWMTVRDCSCENGRIESDAVPGAFYPCHVCNPNWSRLPFAAVETPEIQAAKDNERRWRRDVFAWRRIF